MFVCIGWFFFCIFSAPTVVDQTRHKLDKYRSYRQHMDDQLLFVISHKAKKPAWGVLPTLGRGQLFSRTGFSAFSACSVQHLCFSPSKLFPTETKHSSQKKSQAWVDAGKLRWWVGVIHAADRFHHGLWHTWAPRCRALCQPMRR